MKHYQSKFQSPLLRFVGFLAGLAAQTQVFSGADAASVLEASEGKNFILFRQSQHFRQSNSIVAAYTYTQRRKQVTVK